MSDTFRIDGMTCGGCANAMTAAIRRIDPAAGVAVDLAKGTVTVDGSASAEKIAKAAEAAGFSFKGAA